MTSSSMTSASPGRLTELVWAALAEVRDPELDRAITELGFVTEVRVREDAASAVVRLRLPTYFCAPNFAYLMVFDADRALRAIPGIAAAEVVLEDHFAAEEINAGVAAAAGFAGAFPRLAEREPSELRLIFQRKGYLAAQGRLGRQLVQRGWSAGQMAGARLRDLPEKQSAPLVRRRRGLGLPDDRDQPVFSEEDGGPVPAAALENHLRRGRTTAVGIDANTQFCTGLLAARYPDDRREAGDQSTPSVSATSAGGIG
jgi:metal-sulfur cluster biosynthetic enzyme